jgi:hypothetical protein
VFEELDKGEGRPGENDWIGGFCEEEVKLMGCVGWDDGAGLGQVDCWQVGEFAADEVHHVDEAAVWGACGVWEEVDEAQGGSVWGEKFGSENMLGEGDGSGGVVEGGVEESVKAGLGPGGAAGVEYTGWTGNGHNEPSAECGSGNWRYTCGTWVGAGAAGVFEVAAEEGAARGLIVGNAPEEVVEYLVGQSCGIGYAQEKLLLQFVAFNPGVGCHQNPAVFGSNARVYSSMR